MSRSLFTGLAPMGRARIPIRRALSQADVTGKVTNAPLDPLLEDLIRVNNPLWVNLPRRPGEGPQATIPQRTARGNAAFVDDVDVPSEQESVYGTPLAFPFKTILYNGKVTRRAQAITRNYIRLYAEEVESGVQEVRDTWEDAVINGDASVNPKEFSGFKKLCPSSQKLSMGTNGAPLSLAKLDESIDMVWARPSLGVLSQRTQRQLNALLQVQQRFVNVSVIDGGFEVPTYNGIPLLWSQFVSDTQTQGTATNASSIEWMNTAKFYAEDLTPLFRMPLAKTTSQWDAFDIGIDTVMVLRNEKYVAELNGITP